MEGDITKKIKRSAQVSVFITPAEYEKFKERARNEGRSISNFARMKILGVENGTA